jgi:hypothetical protein
LGIAADQEGAPRAMPTSWMETDTTQGAVRLTDLEMIGLVFSKGFTAVPQRRVDVLQNLQYAKTATLLKSFLGLADTFRDKVPGLALRVTSLTALIRMKGRISLFPEAMMEFDVIKA